MFNRELVYSFGDETVVGTGVTRITQLTGKVAVLLLSRNHNEISCVYVWSRGTTDAKHQLVRSASLPHLADVLFTLVVPFTQGMFLHIGTILINK